MVGLSIAITTNVNQSKVPYIIDKSRVTDRKKKQPTSTSRTVEKGGSQDSYQGARGP